MTNFSKFFLFVGLFCAMVLSACQQPAPGPDPEIQIGRNYDLTIKWQVPDTTFKTKIYLEKRDSGHIIASDTLLLGIPTLAINNFGRLDGVQVKMFSVRKDGEESMPTVFSLSPPKDTGIIITADVIIGRSSIGTINPCGSTSTYSTVTPTASEVDGSGIKTTRYDLFDPLNTVYKASVNTGSSTIVYLVSHENDSLMAYCTNYSCLTGSGFNVIENNKTLLYSSGSTSFKTRPFCVKNAPTAPCLYRFLQIIYPETWTVTLEKCNNCN